MHADHLASRHNPDFVERNHITCIEIETHLHTLRRQATTSFERRDEATLKKILKGLEELVQESAKTQGVKIENGVEAFDGPQLMCDGKVLEGLAAPPVLGDTAKRADLLSSQVDLSSKHGDVVLGKVEDPVTKGDTDLQIRRNSW